MEILKDSKKENLQETEVDIFIREFKEKLNSIGKIEVIDHGDDKVIGTRNWLFLDELAAFYEFQIEDNTMNISYIETLNCDLDFEYDNRMTIDSMLKIPGFGKYLVLDIIENSKFRGLDAIKFTHILVQSEDFYKKIGNFAINNGLITRVIREKYIDPIGDERENIIFKL